MNKPEYSIIAKFLKGQTNEEETAAVESWVTASNENQKEFDQLKTIWEERGELASSYKPDLDKAWTRIERGTRSQIMPWIYRVAAVLVLGLGITYFMMNTESEASKGMVAQAEFVANEGVKEVNLPDGTLITLNEGATISHEASFGEEERRVRLTGEAFFEVSRDEQRPFIIVTKSTTTQVLGTSFSVNPTDESVTVTVVSGKVSFRDNTHQQAVVLTQGEQGNYDRASGEVSETLNDDPNFLAWKTGKLVFDDAPIAQVVADLERFYKVAFELNTPTTENLTALFDNQSLEEVLAIISATLDLEIEEQTPNTYYIN